MDESDKAGKVSALAESAVAREGDGRSFRPNVANGNMAATQLSLPGMAEPGETPVQLSLFDAPVHQPQMRANLFHIRCHECEAVNDVPSIPTICYMCGCPLGRENRPF